MTGHKRLFRNLSIIGSSTMLSRVLGFVRDLLTAVWLGTGPMADAFIIAQRLPNLFRSLLAEGGINSVFVPNYNKQLHENPAQAAAYAANLSGWLLAILIPIVILAAFFMDYVIGVIAPGVDNTPTVFHAAVSYSQVTIFYLIVICFTAMQGAILSAHNNFGPYAAAPAILNLAIIAAMYAASTNGNDIGAAGAWALLAGGLLQTFYLDRVSRRMGIRLGIARPRLNPDVRQFFRNLGPGVLGMGSMNVNILVGTYFASWLPTGAIASLYYADRLNQLPLALIGASLGTLLLPTLTRALHAGDQNSAKRALDQSIVVGLLLSLPVMLGLIILAEPLIRLLFQHGSFTAEDTSHTAQALACFALMLPGAVLGRVLQCCSYARQDTKTPAQAAVFSIILNVVAAAFLVTSYGHVGIALALTLATWGATLMQAVLLYHRNELALGKALPQQIAILFVACSLMAGIMWQLQPLLPTSEDLLHAILHLSVIGGCGLAGYFSLVLLCRKRIFLTVTTPQTPNANTHAE